MASEHGPLEVSSSLISGEPGVLAPSLDRHLTNTTAATQQSSPPELSSSRLVTKQHEHGREQERERIQEQEREQVQQRTHPSQQSSNAVNTSQSTTTSGASNRGSSLLTKSSKGLPGFTPAYSPRPMTGEAAMSDAKQLLDEKRRRREWEDEHAQKTSINPGLAAIQGLVGKNAISRPRDAPSAMTSLSEGMTTAAKALSIPEPMQIDSSHNAQVSPTSISSILSLEGSAPTATASTSAASIPPIGGPEINQSPSHIPHTSQNDPATPGLAPPMEDNASNKALSYPGLITPNTPNSESHPPPRGASLPMSGYSQGSPRSPSAKKHKCPYCSTDFTRHHNLKSHLLTHSHEKPYVCATCQARFRRLHDLKRHTRLHTGERPHQCPRCGRQFARGDALARHNKGQGGCAGRRSSAGSFAGDNDFGDGQHDSTQGSMRGDDGMEGLMYTGDHGQDDGRVDQDEEERRRRSLPMIKAQEVSGSVPTQNGQPQTEQGMYQSQYARTYPPAMGRHTTNPAGGLHPPSHHGGTGSPSSMGQENALSPKAVGSSISTALGGGASSVFAQAMTESPKPLSPGGMQTHQIGHNQSTSYSQHLPRLPPVQSAANPNAPQLPPLAPPDSRHTLATQSGGSQQQQVGQGGQQSQPPTGNGTSLNSYHSHSGGGLPGASSFNNNGSNSGQPSSEGQGNFLPTNQERLWAYVRSLEDRVNRLQDEVEHLRTEVASQHRPADGGSSTVS